MNERASAQLTLCAVFQQGLSHLKPQRAALSWRLPCHFQTLSGALTVEDDCVDHSQVIPKRMTDTASEMSPHPCVLKGLLGCSYITWLWGGRRYFGYWWVWISRWMTWPLQGGGGGYKQMVWWSPLWSLCCSWLGMSDKHRRPVSGKPLPRGASHRQEDHVITRQQADSLNAWLIMLARSQHSLDFCEPETLRY